MKHLKNWVITLSALTGVPSASLRASFRLRHRGVLWSREGNMITQKLNQISSLSYSLFTQSSTAEIRVSTLSSSEDSA